MNNGDNKSDNKSLNEDNATVSKETVVSPSSTPLTPPPPLARRYPSIRKARSYTKIEYWLLLFSVVIATLFDRLFIAENSDIFTQNIFWLLFTAAYYLYSWEKVKNNVVLWVICGLNSLLCIWGFIFDYRSNYGRLTFLVIPAVLMAHIQYSKHDLSLLKCGKIVSYWFKGWIIEPFSAIVHFLGAGKSALKGKSDSKGILKKVLLGLGISLPLILFVIAPLLAGADLVFAYFMQNMLKDFALNTLGVHLFAILLVSIFLFSFFWNYRYEHEDGGKIQEERPRKTFDLVTLSVVLIAVLVVYSLFIGVQFTYLFAQKGLPNNISYSDYAREGFAQIIVISAINISIFAISIYKTNKSKLITILLSLLLICSGIILVSGLSRLNLYIQKYHFTWLRLLSLWFIIYLFAMLAICAIRLFKDKFPALGAGALVLLAWFVILGYSNPDGLIIRYNISQSDIPSEWVDYNQGLIVGGLSDDARLVLHEMGHMPTILEANTNTLLEANTNNLYYYSNTTTSNYYYRTYIQAKAGRSYTSRKLYRLIRSTDEYKEVIEWDEKKS